MRPLRYPRRSPSRGIVLVVALVMLVLVTLVGMASVRTITLEERMASASYDRNLAFQVAETGLREAENEIDNAIGDFVRANTGTVCGLAAGCSLSSAQIALPSGSSSDHFYGPRAATCKPLWVEPTGPTDDTSLPFEAADWDDFWTAFDPEIDGSNTFRATASGKTGYFVELLGCNFACEEGGAIQTCKRFRITSRARGGDGRADVTLQSIYATD